MLILTSALRRLRSERGFTLIETLVALGTGLIVTFAAFALLQTTSEQTSRATDYVQASQLGRVAMTHIVDELNSACLTSEFAPVQSESIKEAGREKMVFIDSFSKEPEIAAGEVQRHELIWTETSGKLGKLEDIKQLGTEKKVTEKGTTFVWSTTKTKTVLGEDIGRTVVTSKGVETTTPIFQYYKYAKGTSETSEAGLSSLSPITYEPELGKEAPEVASVVVSFRSLPTDRSEKTSRAVDLSSQVTFAFSASVAEPTITDGPCQ